MCPDIMWIPAEIPELFAQLMRCGVQILVWGEREINNNLPLFQQNKWNSVDFSKDDKKIHCFHSFQTPSSVVFLDNGTVVVCNWK